jgi:two-component system, chemotaxis family, chemotaxis protein CheY
MRTLSIDDDFVALAKMVTLLGPLGQCDAATCSRQAMELFAMALNRGRPYELVTIDINLPDINGIALLGRLQAEERRRNAPHSAKLMITAESTASNVLASLTGECDGFLVKPVRRAVLMDKLAKLTAAGRLSAQLESNPSGEPLDLPSQTAAAAPPD